MQLPDLRGVPCRNCGEPKLRIEFRTKLVAGTIGTFSLSGQQPKVTATERQWPWAVCDGCGAESEGKR